MYRRHAARIAVFAFALAGCASTGPGPSRPALPAASGPSGGAAMEAAQLREATRGVGGVRPAFHACIGAAAARAPAVQACIASEMEHQQSRLEAGLAARRQHSNSNGSVDEAQAQWAAERDRLCGSDGPSVAPLQRVRAGVCRLEITAARADVLSR